MGVKSRALSITTCGNWVTNMIFGYFTPTWLSMLGAPGLFFIFGCFGCVCWVYVALKVPETRGVSLEQMDALFAGFRGGSLRELLGGRKAGSARGEGLLVERASGGGASDMPP